MRVQSPAALAMTAATICFSILPVAIHLAGGSTSPFWFNASLRAGMIIASALFMASTQRPVLATLWNSIDHRERKRTVVRAVTRPTMLLSTLNAFTYSLLALSFRIVDVSAAVLYETWPINFVDLRQQLSGQPIPIRRMAAFTPAVAGALLVADSQQTNHRSFFAVHPDAMPGAATALTAAIAFTFRAADQIADELPRNDLPPDRTRTAVIMLAFTITHTISLPINVITALLTGETFDPTQMTPALLTGVFIQGSGSILFRLSTILTDNLGVNAIYYATQFRTHTT